MIISGRQHIEGLLRPEFEWQTIEDGPAGLYRLASGDSRQRARQATALCRDRKYRDYASTSGFAPIAIVSLFRIGLRTTKRIGLQVSNAR